MKTLAVLLLCLSTCALASSKGDYQDAVLKSFSTTANGTKCKTNAELDTTTDSATGSSTCRDTSRDDYAIAVGEQIITVTPAMSGKQTVGTSIAPRFSGLMTGKASLYGVLPNTHIQIRQADGAGKYYVRVGKHESLYKLVSAE